MRDGNRGAQLSLGAARESKSGGSWACDSTEPTQALARVPRGTSTRKSHERPHARSRASIRAPAARSNAVREPDGSIAERIDPSKHSER
jgi:hypothetical protein